MPSTGMPSSKMAGSHFGALAWYTLAGPPLRMMPAGAAARISSAGVFQETILL